jgi:AmmeMemoRadiSam system protein B/AmmeMemoRadiSam system protein A
MTSIRSAAVAGSFYPSDPTALRAALTHGLSAAALPKAGPVGAAGHPPKLLVVPHAGYVYSGAVAAMAYAQLAPWRGRISLVVLLGPGHRVAIRGLAAPTVDAFETPLGRIPLDLEALARLAKLPQMVWTDRPHAQEHSLEVQLPFLQMVLGDGFKLVPLVVGQASAAEVAAVLDCLWGGDETLIVISTDLSHYLPYAQAQASDAATAQRILNFATDLRGEEACGAAPLNGALLAARRHQLRSRLLGLINSGDSPAGDRSRVVGYGALAFDTAPDALAGELEPLGNSLLAAARQAIEVALGLRPEALPAAPESAELQQAGASFVSLHDRQGRLRGCVGRLEASRPLLDDVRANALAAAFHDSRFAPLRAEEWPGMQIEVSLLDAAMPLQAGSESEALAALRPGIDGVILEWRGRHATFLPQVWQQLPKAADFMAALKVKAGLPADFWAPDLQLSRYPVRSFSEAVHGGQ